MAFYIPYFVGASMASYLTKNMYSYMTEEAELDIEEPINDNNDNTFLKLSEEPIILESIPEDIEIEEKEEEVIEPTEEEVIEPKEDEVIEPKEEEVIEPKEDEVVEPNEEEVIEPTEEEVIVKITEEIVEKVIEEVISKGNGTIEKANLETIIEEPETPFVQEIIFCSRCSLYLPKRCFSKNQFKKSSKVPKCKICTKLK
jgi:hypothetical protein